MSESVRCITCRVTFLHARDFYAHPCAPVLPADVEVDDEWTVNTALPNAHGSHRPARTYVHRGAHR